MATKTYEGMFLLDSNRYTRDPKGVSAQISEMVEKCGGAMLVSRLWSEQRLAFPIKGHRKGTYWLTYFRMEGRGIADLKRESSLNGNVLRTLVLTVDERLADTLVQHATGGTTTTTPPKDQPSTPAPSSPADAQKDTAAEGAADASKPDSAASADQDAEATADAKQSG